MLILVAPLGPVNVEGIIVFLPLLPANIDESISHSTLLSSANIFSPEFALIIHSNPSIFPPSSIPFPSNPLDDKISLTTFSLILA